MKVTCDQCSRRVNVKPDIIYQCRCGNRIDPFPRGKFENMFLENDYNAVKRIRKRFFTVSDTEEKKEIIRFLIDSSKDPKTSKLSILSALDILRQIKDIEFIDLARRMVRKWPMTHHLRYYLADCLDLSNNRSDHIEALKQRIMGTTIYFVQRKINGTLKNDDFRETMRRHRRYLEKQIDFIEGKREYPNELVERISRHTDDQEEVIEDIKRLEKIADIAGIPTIKERDHSKTVVLDTNAISNFHCSKGFRDPDLRFVAPYEVLIELSNWARPDMIPLELDNVEFLILDRKIPPEIDNMYCEMKGKPPSLTDKKVATLAFHLEADAIASADKDLSRSGLVYAIEKNYGIKIDVIDPGRMSYLRNNLNDVSVREMGQNGGF